MSPTVTGEFLRGYRIDENIAEVPLRNSRENLNSRRLTVEEQRQQEEMFLDEYFRIWNCSYFLRFR